MLRWSLCSILLGSFVLPACENKQNAAPDAPVTPPMIESKPQFQPSIEAFSFEPVAPLQADGKAVTLKLHWQANTPSCELSIGEVSHTVKGQGAYESAIVGAVDVGLSCGSASKKLHVPVSKTLSIVSLIVRADQGGERIEWQSFGAQFCQLTDAAQGIDEKQLAPTGSLLVKSASGPLSVVLKCSDEAGQNKASASYDVAAALKDSEKLVIQSFTGPAQPVEKGRDDEKIQVELSWKALQAETCHLLNEAVPTAGQQVFTLAPGSVTLECIGARFQKAQQSLTLQTRKKLQILRFSAPAEGLTASSRSSWNKLNFEAYGADLCKVKADNLDAFDTVVEEAIIEKQTYIYAQINQATRVITLSCSNSLNESTTVTLPVEVKPRVDVHNLTVTPAKVTRAWGNTAMEKVTLNWKSENYQSCDIIRLTGSEEVVLRSYKADQDETSFSHDVNRTTTFRVVCKDAANLKSYANVEVQFNIQPEVDVRVDAEKLEIVAHGLSHCQVENRSRGISTGFDVDRNQEIKGSISYPYLLENLSFEVSCDDIRKTVSYISPEPSYLVIRQARVEADKLSFEAAWNLGADARDCALYQDEVKIDSIPNQGSRTLSSPAKSYQTRVHALCESKLPGLMEASLLSPKSVCLMSSAYSLLGLPADLKMPCPEMLEKLGRIEFLNLPRRSGSDFAALFPYLSAVKKLKVDESNDISRLAASFPDATTLEYALAFDSKPEPLKLLTKLQSLDLTFAPYHSLDLSFVRKTWPALQEFGLTGRMNSSSDILLRLDENLKGLPLKRLQLHRLALRNPGIPGLMNMPLKSLDLDDVDCFGSSWEQNKPCIEYLPIPDLDKRLALSKATVWTGDIETLERLYDPAGITQMEFTSYLSKSSTFQPDMPNWSKYTQLRELTMWNSDRFFNQPFQTLKTVEWNYSSSNLLGNLSRVPVRATDLATMFPRVENLSLRYASLETLSALWNIATLQQLILNDVIVDHWDVPEGKVLPRVKVISMDFPTLWKALEGIHIKEFEPDTLTLDMANLPAGVIDTMDLRQIRLVADAPKKLATLFGKVRIIQLPEYLARQIKGEVKACTLSRVMNGTTLVHPDLDADWKACESL